MSKFEAFISQYRKLCKEHGMMVIAAWHHEELVVTDYDQRELEERIKYMEETEKVCDAKD